MKSFWPLAVAASLAISACSGKVLDSTTPGVGGRTGGAAGDGQGDGGRVNSGGVPASGGKFAAGGVSAGGHNSTGGVPGTGGSATGGVAGSTCDNLTRKAEQLFENGLMAGGSCTTDADCVYGDKPTCLVGCGAPIVSTKGAEALKEASQVAAPVCAEFLRLGCQVFPPPCIARPGGPGCAAGHCTNLPSAKWSFVTFVETPDRFSSACMTSNGCTRWTVTPDGHVAVLGNSSAGGTMLTAGALQAFDQTVQSVSLRQSFVLGFQCPAPDPQSSFISLIRDDADGESFQQDVTGCIHPGTTQNDPLTLWRILQAAAGDAVDAG